MTIKTSITMRVDRDVLEYYRQGGAGYQTRMNEALREYMVSEAVRKVSKVVVDAGLTPVTEEGE